MSKRHISNLLICFFVLACKGRKPIERVQCNYPIKEIRYDSPRVEVILANGAAIKDIVHLNLLDKYKPGIVGPKAKRIFGEPDHESNDQYESSYEYWSDSSRVIIHFGAEPIPSVYIFLKKKKIDNFLTPELINFVKAKVKNGETRLSIRIENAIDSSKLYVYLNGYELDNIEWTK